MVGHISDRYRCIFVHVPKTGGSSIKATSIFEDQRVKSEMPLPEHATAQEIRRRYPKEFEKYFKFAFVRNPYARLVSAYFYLSRGGSGNARDTEIYTKYFEAGERDFSSFCRNSLCEAMINDVIHLRPQCHFVCDLDLNVIVDFVGRQEVIMADIKRVYSVIGAPYEHYHALWSNNKHYSEYYAGDIHEKVFALYRQDFDLFEYPPSPEACNRFQHECRRHIISLVNFSLRYLRRARKLRSCMGQRFIKPNEARLEKNTGAYSGVPMLHDDKLRIHFVAYGDEHYSVSKRRIGQEAEALRLFETVRIYTQKDRDRWFRDASKETRNLVYQRRGGGYWMWKPFCVAERLSELEDGHVLVYADSGCTIRSSRSAVACLIRLVTDTLQHESGVMCFENPFKEREWTKRDVYERIYPEAFFQLDACQLTANRFILVKKEAATTHAQEWRDYALKEPHLFDDSPSQSPNASEFRENRHDQSVFSLISKRRGCLVKQYADIDPVIFASKKRQ
jgi:hypothetical protein